MTKIAFDENFHVNLLIKKIFAPSTSLKTILWLLNAVGDTHMLDTFPFLKAIMSDSPENLSLHLTDKRKNQRQFPVKTLGWFR